MYKKFNLLTAIQLCLNIFKKQKIQIIVIYCGFRWISAFIFKVARWDTKLRQSLNYSEWYYSDNKLSNRFHAVALTESASTSEKGFA